MKTLNNAGATGDVYENKGPVELRDTRYGTRDGRHGTLILSPDFRLLTPTVQ